jgi:ABC-type Mn2+/Zn2+ transport system permease subunit
MILLAILIGAGSIAAGLFFTYGLSATFEIDLPTGPAIILVAAALFALSAAGLSLGARFGRG